MRSEENLARLTQYGLTISELKSTLKTAKQPYKGSTKLGHALSKHAGRFGNKWGKITGASTTWHHQAMTHFRKIIRDESLFQQIIDPNTGIYWIEKRLPDGRGIRLNLDYTFKGFID